MLEVYGIALESRDRELDYETTIIYLDAVADLILEMESEYQKIDKMKIT